jgi:catechol 2,3-dioxygenase-like lactoylglutathione lyase family enzyme
MNTTVLPGTQEEFLVGGVRLPRPFKIRRLGHFGVNVLDPEVSKHFYCNLLGFRIADPLDFGPRLPAEEVAKLGPSVGYFCRHGTEHHSFVFFPRKVYGALNKLSTEFPMAGGINQITWQVGSLQEVSDGFDWFSQRGKRIHRAGRDLPGSNWHFYPLDPTGHVNELFYGIEQIGWDGYSKPKNMYGTRHVKPPTLPHKSEYSEVIEADQSGVPMTAGWRAEEFNEETYDVGGVLLGRPFKVHKIGPVRLFTDDMEQSLGFYRDDLGLRITEEVIYNGHRCVFLRANTEHHSMALYPSALRAELGLRADTNLMSFGMQLGSYSQLKDAVAYLKQHGVTIKMLPQELSPGIDYCAYAIDPDGNAMQLYWNMEQLGWDGRPRPAAQRARIDLDHWPESVAGNEDAYNGEIFLGPLA